MKALSLLGMSLFFALGGCRGCDDSVSKVPPTIDVQPPQVDFGKVKAGGEAERTLTVKATTNAPLVVSAVRLTDGSAPGGAAAFEVLDAPTQVGPLSSHTLRILFRPAELLAYEAVLQVDSNDDERPTTSVLLSGEGATPKIEVTPECASARGCTGSVTIDPPAIDFGGEPLVRLLPLPLTALPAVTFVNAGEVDLLVSRLAFEGSDAAAFSFASGAGLPAQGELLAPTEGRNIAIRFKPTSEQQQSYRAELVVESDDADRPQVRVALQGTLRANLPPRICANITRVIPGDGSAPVDHNTPQDWAPLLVPPAGGYDFTATRDLRPKSTITFSALSHATDETLCTTDPEDGRSGLSYQWSVLLAPPGAGTVTLGGATNATATLTPKAGSGFATGEYLVELLVRDQQGHTTSTTLKFVIALKEDLVAQLSWQGFADVDLDLHLVRPSSPPFSFFEEAPTGKTSGDVNGWSATVLKNNAGLDFEWGAVGTADDPRLNLDDTGSGQLIENISLNYPENDPACASAPCTYKIYVHYFRDARQSNPAACTVTGTTPCVDGAPCDCPALTRCVANSAPPGSPATGAGKCFAPPQPVLRIFIKANPTPAAVIPLPTDTLPLPAPCQLLYVADVVWPAKNAADAGSGATPSIVVQSTAASLNLSRYGYRQANSTQCSPNTTQGAIDWYALEP
ncbi:MAG: choice-of-anchor D domain-containing protein [Myxococcota bacterium]